MADTSCRADAAGLWRHNNGDGAPITAILHAGGVLADGAAANQTAASVRGAAAPKARAGSELLIQSSSGGQPLRSLVVFSSVAALLGSAGQSPYAAANAAAEALAARVRGTGGVAAASVQFGAWEGVGGMARDTVVTGVPDVFTWA